MFRSVRMVCLGSVVLGVAAASATAIGCAEGLSAEEALLPTEGGAADPRPSDGQGASLPLDDASDSIVAPDADDEEETGIDSGASNDGGSKDGGPKDASPDAAKLDASASADAAADASADAASADASSNDAGGGSADAGDVPKPVQGEIVISEVMYDPLGTEPAAEWVEVYNAAPSPRRLSGLVLRDGGNRTHTILPGVVIAAGTYAVLASVRADVVATKVPASVIVYEYNVAAGTDIQLANSTTGEVVLLDGATEIARAQYGLLGLSSSSNGQSIQLKVLDYASAGVKANWCYSPTTWTTGSAKGTPGGPSNCP